MTSEPNDPDLSEGDLNSSSNRRLWQEGHLDEATTDELARDAQFFLHQGLSTPCLNEIVGCEGSELIDRQGRRILDFHGNSLHQVGYGHPKILEAMRCQLDSLPFSPRRYANRVATDLAERLVSLAPGDLNRVLFAPGGTSAIGMALKLARAATGKHKTISMWDSFHGASLDAISIGGEAMFRAGAGPLLPGCEHVPPPDCRHCPWKCGGECSLACADYVEYVLEKEGGDVAAVISETVRWTPFVPPREYWTRIRAACDRYGAKLILDEVPSAFGRTGKMFVCEHYDIVPDILVVGKGLGGGVMPLAAMLAKEELNEAMPSRALGHYTHEKSPLACAAGLAMLNVLEEEDLLAETERKGAWLLEQLEQLKKRFPVIVDVRGLGLLVGIEMGQPETPEGRNSDLADRLLYACLSRGLSFKVTMGNVLTWAPPLTVKEEELVRALAILEASLSECLNPAKAS